MTLHSIRSSSVSSPERKGTAIVMRSARGIPKKEAFARAVSVSSL